MDSQHSNYQTLNHLDLPKRNGEVRRPIQVLRIVLAVVVVVSIILMLVVSTVIQREMVIKNAGESAKQMAKHVAADIDSLVDYAQSSIRFASVSISQQMTSEDLENPSEIILPLVENTPFGAIEYIRSDGMNVMNIGEPFDASDRVYYIEGIQGNSGIWNNYHPKTSKETLMNFYTPLMYNGKASGVITGYVAATSQIAPLFETKFYGKEVHGLLIDENNMVICSTTKMEYVNDLTLEMFLEQFDVTEEQSQQMYDILQKETEGAVSFTEKRGEGRIAVSTIPNLNWKVAIIVPPTSFSSIVGESANISIIAIIIISILLIAYAAFIIFGNARIRKRIAAENAKLEEDNRIFNEANQRAFSEISEIRDIIASANMGTWRIELVENEEPRMYVDDKMKELLGVASQDETPEMVYTDWFSNITPEAVPSVLHSVERMQQGYFDENTYLWKHPKKGIRYVRCGGTAQSIPGGFSLRGYHYDVDEVVRAEQAQMELLRQTLEDKNEYYSTLGALGDLYYSMHVLDLRENTAQEFKARNEVKEIANHKNGAVQMMSQVITTVVTEEYLEAALEFTDLTTVSERLRDKQFISKQLLGKHIGWFIASFITLEQDEKGVPVKVIFTSRVNDEEKKQEETLIRKSQTDELTGLLNRRAYEEDIYENDGIPEDENLIYMSLDVNGLKVVNDTLGHLAGDELITGSCWCMKKSLGQYGKLYRVGGDEFVAILSCDIDRMKEVEADFAQTIQSWSGKLINGLSISYGWVGAKENPDATMLQLGVLAEKRMYEAKSAHYRATGVDRRGQQDAHKALCELYTKILRINLTEDSYQIINMDTEEQTAEKGFADRISEWLMAFGKTGQVHSDDLEEYLRLTDIDYLRAYFAGGKTSLNIFYRRKYEDGFKQVMMEMIPTKDYSQENQSLFLYVKSIDK